MLELTGLSDVIRVLSGVYVLLAVGAVGMIVFGAGADLFRLVGVLSWFNLSRNPHVRLWRKPPFGSRFSECLGRIALVVCVTFNVAACGKAPSVPDRVERKDGLAYIPIDDTAFLIPEKTWLKGYSRNSTDGLVASITLHATIPDVQPWSSERHEEMYWPAGPGKKLEIRIKGDRADQVQVFPVVPNSIRQSFEFIEEPSDQAAQGLRRFRELWSFYKDEKAEMEAIRRWGREFVEKRRRDAGKPMLGTVYYEFIEHERVKYFIHCSDSKEVVFQGCHLLFPLTQTLMVDVHFVRDHIRDIVAMADKLSDRLREFEAAGLAYRAARIQSEPPSSRQ